MKRRSICLVLAVLILCLPAGCTTNSNTNSSDTQKTAAVPNDYTVTLPEPFVLEGKEIQLSYGSSEPYKIYNAFSDYKPETHAAVRGTIDGVEYFHDGAYPFTKIDLTITVALSGPLNEGDKISAYKWGGYIALKDAVPDIQDRYPEITDEEMTNTIQDVRIDGDPHPIIGQDVVLLLKAPDETQSVYSGMYGIIGNYFGQFTNDGAGTFARHIEQIPDGVSGDNITNYMLQSQPEVDRTNMTGTNRAFTYEQLENELLNVLK